MFWSEIIALIILITPFILLAFWMISLFVYLVARNKNAKIPGTFSPDQMKNRQNILVVATVLGVLAVIFIAMIIGMVILVCCALAYM